MLGWLGRGGTFSTPHFERICTWHTRHRLAQSRSIRGSRSGRSSRRSSARTRPRPLPTGTPRSMELRNGRRSSGRSLARRLVRTAAMPQPMSTPTAAGMIAPRVGITEPTVAPLPRCTSGITATHGPTNGMLAMLRSCSWAWSSSGTPRTQPLACSSSNCDWICMFMHFSPLKPARCVHAPRRGITSTSPVASARHPGRRTR